MRLQFGKPGRVVIASTIFPGRERSRNRTETDDMSYYDGVGCEIDPTDLSRTIFFCGTFFQATITDIDSRRGEGAGEHTEMGDCIIRFPLCYIERRR